MSGINTRLAKYVSPGLSFRKTELRSNTSALGQNARSVARVLLLFSSPVYLTRLNRIAKLNTRCRSFERVLPTKAFLPPVRFVNEVSDRFSVMKFNLFNITGRLFLAQA